MNIQPLVTAVCPTVCPKQDRYELLRKAIEQFQAQDYPNREMLILYGGVPGAGRFLTEDRRVQHIGLIGDETIGEKRNIGCHLGHGEIICHWDDDDWYFPSRISEQVSALLASGADVTGYGKMLFVDPLERFCVRYDNDLPHYVIGNSLMYRKTYWQKHQFDHVAIGEDNGFVAAVPEGRLYVQNGDQIIARLHNQQTCQRPREVYQHGEPWREEQWEGISERLCLMRS